MTFGFLKNEPHLSRRAFAWGAVGGLLLSSRVCAEETGKPACKPVDLKEDQKTIGLERKKLYFWVSGLDRSKRARVAVYLDIEQKETEYVDKVILINDSNVTIGARYFSQYDYTKSKRVPYMIFENVSFRGDRYFVLVQMKANGENKVYRFALVGKNVERSLLEQDYLPTTLVSDLKKAHQGVQASHLHILTKVADGTACKVSKKGKDPAPLPSDKSPERDPILDCLERHVFKAGFVDIDFKGNFTLKVVFTHRDESATHFMRYFVVTDPVGRLLGVHRRVFGDKAGEAILKNPTPQIQKSLGLEPSQVANINDCPYVMVFAEDMRDMLLQRDIWLR